jgi:hypothetical protein
MRISGFNQIAAKDDEACAVLVQGAPRLTVVVRDKDWDATPIMRENTPLLCGVSVNADEFIDFHFQPSCS